MGFSFTDVSLPLQKVWISSVNNEFSDSDVLMSLQKVWIGFVDSNVLAQQAGRSDCAKLALERRFELPDGAKLALERHFGRPAGTKLAILGPSWLSWAPLWLS